MADHQPPAHDMRLRVVAPDQAEVAPALTPRNFIPLRLILQPGKTFVDLEKPNAILGRHSTADIRLPLPDVSRRHCRLAWSGGVWRVFDLQSANGTFVNGERIAEATLHLGDSLQIGGFTFTIATTIDPRATVADSKPAASEESILRSIADALPRRRAS